MRSASLQKIVFTGLLCLGLATQGLHADERHFAYSYEADSILPKGKVEFEQWATLRSGKENGVYSRWDLRHELEYGFTDTLTGALYINTTSTYANGVNGYNDTNSMSFYGLSAEIKKMILSPHLNPVGVLLYFEPAFSGKEAELEGKLVLQHIHNEKWNFAANIISELEWEYEANETEQESVLGLNAGVSYQLTPKVSLGLETKIESLFEGFYEEQETTLAYVGPNIHYGNDKVQLTAALLKQVTDNKVEGENVEFRLIAGIFF